MPVIGWVDTDALSDLWPDSDVLDGDSLALLLAAAYSQCVEFLPPPLFTPNPTPSRYVLAQVLQAKALARASVSGTDDSIGPDGMTVTVFPMDWTVKALLRPKHVGRVL